MTTPPLGKIQGMRWCCESNRYYADDPNRFARGPLAASSSISPQHSDPIEYVRRTPVQKKIVTSLPRVSKKRSNIGSIECAICLRGVVDNQPGSSMRFIDLPCKHSFHMNCIENWLSHKSGSCPLCRIPVDTSLATAAASINGQY